MALRDTSTLPINVLIRGGQQYRAAKKEVNRLAIAFAESGGSANQVIGIVRYLKNVRPALIAVVDEPGMLQLARDTYGDQGYDVVVLMGVLLTAIETDIVDIVALFPTGAGDRILSHKYNAQYDLVPDIYTGVQLAPLIAKLNEISAAVD